MADGGFAVISKCAAIPFVMALLAHLDGGECNPPRASWAAATGVE